jgi:hypothetical protein
VLDIASSDLRVAGANAMAFAALLPNNKCGADAVGNVPALKEGVLAEILVLKEEPLKAVVALKGRDDVLDGLMPNSVEEEFCWGNGAVVEWGAKANGVPMGDPKPTIA